MKAPIVRCPFPVGSTVELRPDYPVPDDMYDLGIMPMVVEGYKALVARDAKGRTVTSITAVVAWWIGESGGAHRFEYDVNDLVLVEEPDE